MRVLQDAAPCLLPRPSTRARRASVRVRHAQQQAQHRGRERRHAALHANLPMTQSGAAESRERSKGQRSTHAGRQGMGAVPRAAALRGSSVAAWPSPLRAMSGPASAAAKR